MTPRAVARGRPLLHDRQVLLGFAAEVLLDGGPRSLTHASLAKRAGIATASVQHHFPTASQLRNDALDYKARVELDELLADLEQVPDAWNKVRLVIRDSICDEPPRQRTGWMLWLAYYSAAAGDASIAARVEHTRMAWRAMLADIIEHGQHDGSFRTASSAQECASILFALIDGFGIRLAAPGPSDDADHIVAIIEDVAARLLVPTV